MAGGGVKKPNGNSRDIKKKKKEETASWKKYGDQTGGGGGGKLKKMTSSKRKGGADVWGNKIKKLTRLMTAVSFKKASQIRTSISRRPPWQLPGHVTRPRGYSSFLGKQKSAPCPQFLNLKIEFRHGNLFRAEQTAILKIKSLFGEPFWMSENVFLELSHHEQ
jgi:hypothetical protein